jgi:hypothetical protein
MPHFFFDMIEDGKLVRDLEGLSLQDTHAACMEASSALVDLAEYSLRNGNRVHTNIEVRDRTGSLVFRATLTFESEQFR